MPETQEMDEMRKIVQITSDGNVIALCNDGTLWRLKEWFDFTENREYAKWEEIREIPQGYVDA